MVSSSFWPEFEIGALKLFPSRFQAGAYADVFRKIPILRAFLNSLLVSGSVTAGALVFGSMVGYALARLRFKGREAIFMLILFTMMLPLQITLIPMYILMVRFGWVNTYWALIVPFVINGFSILLFRQYFKTIPQELVDAARMDGCSDLRILFRIFWPISKPALITAGLLVFMNTWNEVLWPLIIIRDRAWMTMPQIVTVFAVGGQAEGMLGVRLAAATMLALPIVLAYIFFQKYFIDSMATSGLKG